jgi:tRNA A-37 threonylcarbamoyl transferase component Bud32
MDLRYEAFCFADPLFFDEQRDTGVPESDFAGALPVPASGWVSGEHGVWRMLRPEGQDLPLQGWKIHVSAGLDNADSVLATVHAHCIEHVVAFKHLRTRSILLARNSKYAPREGSGKLLTLYPADEDELEQLLVDLSPKLEGEQGPYILSDLRYGNGPLYVRYGGFAELWVESAGTRVLAIRRPDGTLVPDKREPTFSTPDWVKIPNFLVPHLAARKSGDPAQFPYHVTGSLHFSNGGGVYLAERNADGERVVLKEARPHAGLDAHGLDAVARLRGEHEVLTALAGIPGIPRAHDRFIVWEHHFLEMEYMPGVSLGSWLARNYPLTRRDRTEADFAEYTARALELLDRITGIIDQVHERGFVFGDLHGLNVLVDIEANGRDFGQVSLIDFELSGSVEDGGRRALGAPGFRAQADRTGFEIDAHALAALRLWLFLPLNTLLELAPAKLHGLVDFIERRFDLPDGYGASILRELEPRTGAAVVPQHTELDHERPDFNVVRKSIAEAILASATLERLDRLFPGDIDQFRLGGSCFGFGAAGVLHALDVTGAGRYPEHERWLLDSVRRNPPARPGFYDGSYGIAYVLENFGYSAEASALLSASAGLVETTEDHGLESGLSGIGLTLLHFAVSRGDNEFGRRALAIGVRLAHQLEMAASPGKFARAGLLSGWSGPALLFIQLFERTGEPGWLSFADQALCRDLEECVTADDGSLQARDGERRTLPYVGVGSAGVLMVIEELAAKLPVAPGVDARSVDSLAGLRQACEGEFMAYPSLMYGRGGLMSALAMGERRAPENTTSDTRALIDRHLSRLAWHAVPYHGGLAFPGNELLRLSMDVNTGGAGVLLSLAATLDGTAVLPFFGAAHPSPRAPGH